MNISLAKVSTLPPLKYIDKSSRFWLILLLLEFLIPESSETWKARDVTYRRFFAIDNDKLERRRGRGRRRGGRRGAGIYLKVRCESCVSMRGISRSSRAASRQDANLRSINITRSQKREGREVKGGRKDSIIRSHDPFAGLSPVVRPSFARHSLPIFPLCLRPAYAP